MRIHYLKVREQSSKSKMSLKKEYQVLIQNHINFENGTLELKVHVLVGARDRQYIEKMCCVYKYSGLVLTGLLTTLNCCVLFWNR